MRIISLLTTAVLAIALYGCTTDKPEPVQEDKPDIVKSKTSDVKPGARDLKSKTSRVRKTATAPAQRKLPRNYSGDENPTIQRRTRERTVIDTTIDSRDGDRAASERAVAERNVYNRTQTERGYTARDYDDRDYGGSDYDDRGYGGRNYGGRAYDDRNYDDSDVGSAPGASSADYR